MDLRKIDAEIADRVMMSLRPLARPVSIQQCGAEVGMWKANVSSDPPGSMDWFCPRFSTDPAASKQLRDRMRELGFDYMICADSGKFGAAFSKLGEIDGHDPSLSETEELAVALAALRCFGIDTGTAGGKA